ncbi:hypothetical protein PR048_010774 [Dryococelus australis]|uniref:Uncharacterized protein n=1 Tax=Dryococelus australis TaxID=614101 RepID=A0ABQ9I3N2_9NEOP|nr:hypothetical protein PR048_010774 [Dryococelus australis]
MKRRGKREIPEETRLPAASSGTRSHTGKSGSDSAENRTREVGNDGWKVVLRGAAGAGSIAPRRNRRPASPSPLPGTMRSWLSPLPSFRESRECRHRRDLLASQTYSRLLEIPIRLATTQECSGETGWRLGPPRRITRVGEYSRWRPKTLYILPQPSGRQSLTEAVWRVCAREVKCGLRLVIAGRWRVRCSWLEWTRGCETDERSGFNPQPGIMPDDVVIRRVFSGISRFPRPFIPTLLIGSQDLDVKSRPNLFTHSLDHCAESVEPPRQSMIRVLRSNPLQTLHMNILDVSSAPLQHSADVPSQSLSTEVCPGGGYFIIEPSRPFPANNNCLCALIGYFVLTCTYAKNAHDPSRPAHGSHKQIPFNHILSTRRTYSVESIVNPALWQAGSRKPMDHCCHSYQQKTCCVETAYALLHHRGSKLDPRSDLRSTQKTVVPFEFRAGLEIKMKFISNHRNWRFDISIRNPQPLLTNID